MTSPGLVEIVTREPVMHLNGETLQGAPIGAVDPKRWFYVVDRAAVKVEELKPGTWHVFPTRRGHSY